RCRVRPNARLQTDTAMAERLYELALDAAGLTGGETVYDLYCGIGTIGLVMAGRALTVWGVDVSEESVACALENADLNGIGNAAFFAGNVGQALEELRDRAGPPDVVVVDPPRAGLAGKALRPRAARASRVERIHARDDGDPPPRSGRGGRGGGRHLRREAAPAASRPAARGGAHARLVLTRARAARVQRPPAVGLRERGARSRAATGRLVARRRGGPRAAPRAIRRLEALRDDRRASEAPRPVSGHAV